MHEGLFCDIYCSCKSIVGARIAVLCTRDYFVTDILFMQVCCWCTYCYFVHEGLFCDRYIVHASLLLVHVLLLCAR